MSARMLSFTWPRWRRIRKAVQVLSLALYIYLLFAALQRRAAFPLADLFLRLDPLAALGAMLASREWIPRLALALITLGLTLVLGRVWCGWLCPLGTILEWTAFRSASRRSESIPPRWRMVKVFVLFVIVAAALFGNLTLLIFDPLTLLTRTMTTVILPALNYAVTAVQTTLYPVRFLQPALDWAEGLLRGAVLPVKQPVFLQNALIAGIFVAILALNALADRFWCRYLCPLGALLGLLSRIALLRPMIGPACNLCGWCANVCRVGAIENSQGYEIVPAECTVCLDCLAACPQQGVGFLTSSSKTKTPPAREYDPTRRQALAALAIGMASVVVLRTDVRTKQHHPLLIRPPGVEDEEAFLARCLRCSQCMKVCPTSGLQPVLLEAGLEGIWTPRLVPRLGYCNYGCNACGQVCPSNAIPPLDLASKRQAVLGVAAIDHNRCLPWADGVPCIVCEEMCPVPNKAIRLEEVTVTDARGELAVVQRPHVVSDLCIGCGICEYQCPVGGEAAIRVRRR
jgi:MauM/NapG family ferredoxin protein